MRNMKKNIDSESSMQIKERHIVTWSQQEDDILRDQIRIHGTENWTIIASKFNDKSTRQCRRRWYTYLNTDIKKGCWSPEEDKLLCEAQIIYGNKWTEISKVVSGRTDNAVKNRFTTLCKKRANSEAMAKENKNSSIIKNRFNTDKEAEIVQCKKMRKTHLTSDVENQQRRHPFAVLDEKFNNIGNLQPESYTWNTKEAPNYAIGDGLQSVQNEQQNGEYKSGIDNSTITNEGKTSMACHDIKSIDEVLSTPSLTEFSSPLQVTPLFRSLAEEIPTPQFSESERSFLMKTLGLNSPSSFQLPTCKRALLPSL